MFGSGSQRDADDREDASDGVRLRALLEEHRIDTLQATPSTWRLLLEAGWRGGPQWKALCGGEALPTELAEALLDSLGYKVKQTSASQQIILAGMAEKRLDLFLGYWQPTMQSVAKPYLDKQQIDVISPATLSDAQSTYAVPAYVYDAGLKTFADIAKFRDKLDNGRKLAIQILEFFDRHGITIRRGDLRRAVPQKAGQYGPPPTA